MISQVTSTEAGIVTAGSAAALTLEIEKLPDGEQHIQHAVGRYIAQADRGSTATVSVNREDKDG